MTDQKSVMDGLTATGVIWAFSNTDASNWHPITWLSHMAAVEAFGLNAGGHHLVNLALHLANVVLLFLVLARLTRALWPSAIAAAGFAWHPLQVESVAWISERKGLLCGFFWLLTVWLYARYVERPNRKRYVLTLVGFFLGLASKPMAITFPFALLLLDVWPLKRLRNSGAAAASAGDVDSQPTKGGPPWLDSSIIADAKRLLKEKIPMFALVLTWVFLTYASQSSGGAVVAEDRVSLAARVSNPPIAYVRYLSKFLWPANLGVLYPHPGSWPVHQVLGALSAIAAATWFVFRQRRKRIFLFVGWCWFLGILTPVLQIVPIGSLAIADRYMYLPMIGLWIMIVWSAREATQSSSLARRLTPAVASIAAIAFLATTRAQLHHWRNSESLLTHTLEVEPDNPFIHGNLAVHLKRQGRFAESQTHFHESIRLNPRDAEMHYNLGNLLTEMETPELALKSYQEALRFDPKHSKAHNNLGNALIKLGRTDEGMASYLAALELDPDAVATLNNIGKTLMKQGKLGEALDRYKTATDLHPDHEESFYNLGCAYQAAKRPDLAVQSFQRSLELNSDSPPAWNNLANSLLDLGRTGEALKAYEQALRLRPDYYAALVNLAMTLEDAGDPARAITRYSEAVRLRPNDLNTRALLGGAMTANGSYADAADEFRRALQSQPNFPAALNGLARIHAAAPHENLRNGRAAVELARRACELTGRQRPDFLDTLAAALAESGEFDEAVSTAGQAWELANRGGRTALAAAIERRRESYRSRQVFRLGQ